MNPRFHQSVLKAVRENSYRISDAELADLVSTKSKADTVAGALGDDYFRILVRRSSDYYGEPSTGDAISCVDEQHKGMMTIVSAVLITPDIAPNPDDDKDTKASKTKARQGKTKFASSAASVLRRYLKAGGRLSDLDPETHGKSVVESLARAMESERATEAGENTPETKVRKRLASLITALNQCADKPAMLAECIKGLNEC